MEDYKQEITKLIDSIKDEKKLDYLLVLAKKFAETERSSSDE